MKKTKLILYILPIILLSSCGSNDSNSSNVNSESTIVHNYVDTSNLTIMKNVDKSTVVNYATNSAKQIVKKENVTVLNNAEAYTYFQTFTDDELYYRFYDGFQDSSGRVLNLKEIWLFPEAGAFILKNELNSYETLGSLNYQYQNTALTAVKIGIKASTPMYAGTYYQYCVNSNTWDVASYKVDMTFSIPQMEAPSALCDANKSNCNWQLVQATNSIKATESFKSNQSNLCTKSYNLLQGCFNYLQSFLNKINNSYNVLS